MTQDKPKTSVRPLILARQFFLGASGAVEAEAPFVRMQRTMHLDLAVELTLNAVISEFGDADDHNRQGGRRDLEWSRLWDLADEIAEKVSSKHLPERSKIGTLHQLRNLAQHKGAVPSSEDLHATIVPVRSLLEHVCSEVFDLSFYDLQEWHVLRNNALRDWLGDCREALSKEQSFVAVSGCHMAYRRIVSSARMIARLEIPNSLPHVVTVQSREMERVVGGLAKGMENFAIQVQRAIGELEAQIVATSIGLSVADHHRFRRITSRVAIHEFPGGAGWMPDCWETMEGEEALSDAEFALAYLGRAAVLLESSYPDVFDTLTLPGSFRESRVWKEHLETGSG